MSDTSDGVSPPAELAIPVRRLWPAVAPGPVALRFARESWPKGEIAPGVTLEIRDA